MEIVGYENYLIYPDGKVYSKVSKRYLLISENRNGYLYVNLCNDEIRKKFTIHRLIAEHYIPNPDNKRCVDHINRDKKDNRIENLRWATNSENGQNKGVAKNNTSGHKNIIYNKIRDRYKYEKQIRGHKHQKFFKTLEEAIAYKKDYENQNQDLS